MALAWTNWSIYKQYTSWMLRMPQWIKSYKKEYEISCGEFTNYFFIGARRTLNRVSAWYAHHTEYIWKVSVFVTFDCFVLIFTNYYQLNFHSQTLETKSTTIRLWAAKNGFFPHFACCQWLFFAFNRTEGLIWILFDNQRCNQSKWRRPVTPNSHLAAIRMICKIFDCLDLWWFCWKSITLDSIRILFMFGSSIIAMKKNAPYFFSSLVPFQLNPRWIQWFLSFCYCSNAGNEWKIQKRRNETRIRQEKY